MPTFNEIVTMAKHLDVRVFSFINQTCANPVCDGIMPIITSIGSGEGIFILSLLVLALAKGEKKKAALIFWAGLTVTYYVSVVLKGAIARPRPFVVLPAVHLLISGSSFSFPSTHTMQSFMAATVASRYFGWRALFFGFALLVGISRITLGVHYPSDILAGAVLGILIGYALTRFAKID